MFGNADTSFARGPAGNARCWSLATRSDYEKVDATKVKFLVPLKPREKQQFSYELTVRHGTNAKR